jgi:hypothetical protein
MINKNLALWGAGVSATIALLMIIRSKSANAQPKGLLHEANVQSINIIGDSQTKRHLGKAYAQVFSDKQVNFFGKEGATHEKYLNDPSLLNAIQSLGCADLTIIQLGDNGVSNRIDKISEFVAFVANACPNSQIIWGGPMKAVKPTVPSSYVFTDPKDVGSFKYLPKYNNLRRTWDNRLRNALLEAGIPYVSNFELQESQPLSSAFSDSRGGDGIHLTENSAIMLAHLMRELVFGERLI